MKKGQYIAPEVEIIEIVVEKGFASSYIDFDKNGSIPAANGSRGDWDALWD